MTQSRTWKPKGIAASGKSALPASHKEIWNDKLAHEGKILCSIMLRMRPLPARVLQGLMQIRPKVREACLRAHSLQNRLHGCRPRNLVRRKMCQHPTERLKSCIGVAVVTGISNAGVRMD